MKIESRCIYTQNLQFSTGNSKKKIQYIGIETQRVNFLTYTGRVYRMENVIVYKKCIQVKIEYVNYI